MDDWTDGDEGIADDREILRVLTCVMRGECGAKAAEILRAAEMLGRRRNLLEPPQDWGSDGRCVIIDDTGE